MNLSREARLNQYLEAMPFGVIVLDENKVITYANNLAELMLGSLLDSDGQMPDWDTFVTRFYRAGMQEPYPDAQFPTSLALQGKIERSDDIEIKRHGVTIPLEVFSSPIFGDNETAQFAITTFQDITERKLGESILLESKARFQTVLDDQLDLVCRFLPDGSLTYVNKAFCDYFGIRSDEFSNHNFLQLISAEGLRKFTDSKTKLTPENYSTSVEHRLKNRLDQQQWLRWTERCFFDEEGRPLEFQATGQEVTEQKQIEEELHKHRNHLEELVDQRTIELFEVNTQLQQQRQMAESLQEVATVLNSSLNQDKVMTAVLEQLRQVVDYDGAAICLEEEGQLVISDARGISEQYLGHRFSVSGPDAAAVVLRRKAPDVIPDTSDYLQWVLWEKGAMIRSWMGAPLLAGNKTIGVLAVDSAQPHAYGEEDAGVLQAFANQAAIAVLNARLYDQAQAAAASEERERLARDLHDAVTQTLFTASIIAEALPLQWQQDTDAALHNLEKLRQLTRGALAEMRTLLMELRPTALAETQLAQLLEQLIEAMTGRNKLPVTLQVEGAEGLWIPPEVKIAIYRIAQEAFNNIAKHAQASRVSVELTFYDNGLFLSVWDDGQGFEPDSIPPGHLGVGIMHERAQKIDAMLNIESGPRSGTRLTLRWPYTKEETR